MPRNGANVYSPPPGTLATTLTTIKSPEYNAFVNDLTADANLARPIVAGGTGATNAVSARDNLGLEIGVDILGISYAPPGHLYGLTLANNGADATNDIDISTGSAASDGTTPALMTLASSLTKRLDAAWAVGSGNGGLDTGSIANGTYHVWLIQRSDTSVVDALFSASATSPTMPTNYDRKRRIGSIIRESGAIVAFTQIGDYFYRTPVTDRSSVAAAASTLFTISVPTGIVVQPLVALLTVMGSAGNIQTQVANAGTSALRTVTGVSVAAQMHAGVLSGGVFTNTSGQIQFAVIIASGTLTTNVFTTYGWIDTRGRI